MTLKRAEGSKLVGARLRNDVVWRARRSTRAGPRLDTHRHDDAEVVFAVARLDHCRVELAGDLDPDVVGDHLREEIREVARIEADRDGLALVVDLELLAHLAELRVIRRHAQETRLEGEADATRLRSHERGTLERLEERTARDDGRLRVGLGDDLLVGR